VMLEQTLGKCIVKILTGSGKASVVDFHYDSTERPSYLRVNVV
jgi:hypothetical protein